MHHERQPCNRGSKTLHTHFPPVTTQRALVLRRCCPTRSSRKTAHERPMRTKPAPEPALGRKLPTKSGRPLGATIRARRFRCSTRYTKDGCRHHGGESGIVNSQIPITTRGSCTRTRSATWGSVPRGAQ